jgi:hypothetical protein
MDNGSEVIIREWGLNTNASHSKEEIIQALAKRIDEMLSDDPMGFLQIMYRLDISEPALDQAMEAENASMLIAGLVWDRQTQKQAFRQSNPYTGKKVEDEELEW